MANLTHQMQTELGRRESDLQVYKNLTVNLGDVLHGERSVRRERQEVRQNLTSLDSGERQHYLDVIKGHQDTLDDAKRVIAKQQQLLQNSSTVDIQALNEANKTRQQIRKISQQIADIITSNEENGSMIHAL